jgi:hypothetical protein
MRARSSSSPSDLRRPVALAAPPSVDRTCTSTVSCFLPLMGVHMFVWRRMDELCVCMIV